MPWLLLAATALFAMAPLLRRWTAGAHAAPSPARAVAGVLTVAVYGGYFNGGLGILLLALFGLLGAMPLHAMNGLKNVVSALLTAIAVAVYAAGGLVLWPQALGMMVAATAGRAWRGAFRRPGFARASWRPGWAWRRPSSGEADAPLAHTARPGQRRPRPPTPAAECAAGS
ncbi:hypothetical protein AVHM3334_18915 [Acidovorax sp. SUPP3334]|nr:hypothetical protein AVHM3334_18915 [Acidovorax sp. SUPP3334]